MTNSIADMIKQAQELAQIKKGPGCPVTFPSEGISPSISSDSGNIRQKQELSRVRLGIGIPHNYQNMQTSFFDSFIALVKPPYYKYMRSRKRYIEDMRNEIVEMALETECTHLIMMDTDQTYHPQTLIRLLEHSLPIVGCLVYRRYAPFDPLMFTGIPNNYKTITKWGKDELVSVDATGTGCLMINMEVFKNLPRPWFKTSKDDPEVGVGEDFYFCGEARRFGYQIKVDTAIPAGHLSQIAIDGSMWKLYGHIKAAEANHAYESITRTASFQSAAISRFGARL